MGSFDALCKISSVKIFKRLLLLQFSFSFKQSLLYLGREGIQAVTVFGDLPKFKKKIMALKKLYIHRTVLGWKFQNATSPTVFIQSGPNFMINTAVIGEYKVMDILAICQKLKILWHFEILTWESMGKPKMWNISKTANRRPKRTKMWDSGSYCEYMEGTFDTRFL